jgi:nucleotide-binding universal stress UspA family protein
VINVVLLNSGRPVLVVPPDPLTSVGGNIVVAWSRSAGSVRALNTAMPLFAKADRLRLVYVDTGANIEPSAEEAATYLARHGIESEVEIITPYDRSVGAALVRYAQDADLLVLGAYSLSYVCGAVLGRVTRHVRAHAQTPVLIV